jgi:leucyl aminopeptidase
MKVAVIAGSPLSYETPLLVLPCWEGDALPDPIAPLIEEGDWRGKARQTTLLYSRGAVPAKRVLLVGIGKRSAGSVEQLREASAQAAQRARDLGVEQFAIGLPSTEGLDAAAAAQALAEGARLGVYRFTTYRTNLKPEDTRSIAEVVLLAEGEVEKVQQGVDIAAAIADGVYLARDLANGPGNDITPTKLGETAQALGQEFGFNVTVLDKAALEEQGFGGILGVGKGSAQEPRFIVLEYGQKQEGTPTICIVGKGITFDTGGISIKPADRMDEMKTDMSGAAAVLGTMRALGTLKLPIHVVGLISSAENMPSSTAYKPGDILKTLSGKTVEVLNTDAEGRIVLADALYYAQRYQPNAIIDLATLTGAIIVALGTHATGLMSNNDDLAARLARAGDATGERVWRMPLWEPYIEMVKSEVADIRNTGGGRQGGAITAAAFLAQFVGEYPWAHLDIAGTAYFDRQTRAYAPRGATGVGVRLLVSALQEWAARQ